MNTLEVEEDELSILFLPMEFETSILFFYSKFIEDDNSLSYILQFIMKSIKNLNNSQSNRELKFSPLASIDGIQNIKAKRQKIQVPCAFHPSDYITNFCKNMNCLLPLCPKCVKIHTEQHSDRGNFAKFEAIQDCLDEFHETTLYAFSQASKMQKMSLEMEDAYARKKNQTIQQLERAKLMILQHITNVFKGYEEAIQLQFNKQDRLFTQQLIQYHSLMSSMMESCRNGAKKFSNKNTIMEGLISFYSKGDYPILLKQCEQKLIKITSPKIEIILQLEQLQKFDDIIRRYMRIGGSNSNTDKYIADQRLNRSFDQSSSLKPQFSMMNSNTKYHENIELDFYGGLQNLKTPLDNFSLQKSRNTRVTLTQQKQTRNRL